MQLLPQFAESERTEPLPVKRLPDRRIYLAHNDFGSVEGIGGVVLTDFGHSVRGDAGIEYNHDVQPPGYEAPEVLLRATWTYSADIWSLAVMVRFCFHCVCTRLKLT